MNIAAAFPVNLVSFCFASTFDIPPSPSNIRRWKISTDTAYTLCMKDIWTTALILGACLGARGSLGDGLIIKNFFLQYRIGGDQRAEFN